jgi:hypothetical protein
MRSIPFFRILLTGLCLVICFCSYAQIKYPVARKEAFDTVIYGKKLSDDYYWMIRKSNEQEAKEFSRQQGMLTQRILDSIPGSSVIEKE